jgi:hypothetical protein
VLKEQKVKLSYPRTTVKLVKGIKMNVEILLEERIVVEGVLVNEIVHEVVQSV